ncbi:MAG: insulinase family protein [Rikenellaceae bacterium]|nr:insulinase family protein [Rikenellaceae bacterium]
MQPIDKKQPAVSLPGGLSLPAARRLSVGNGSALYALDVPGSGVVRMSFVFRAGSVWQEVPFSASATANLLSEGTAELSAQQVAERLDFYGSYFDVTIDRDYAVITFCTLGRFFEPTLEIARQVLLAPTFPEAEVETYRNKRRESLAVERAKVSVQARELFARTLFGADHPYGISSPESRYDELRRQDLERFYRRRYRAANCFAVCSGELSERIESGVADLLAALPGGTDDRPLSMPAPQRAPHAFLRHEGAVQSAVRVGRLLFPRSHPDFVGMQVTSTLLGGYFGSRLVRNLREERGYTYGVFATMVNLDRCGYLAVATDVAADATADTVEQIFAEMNRLRTETVSDEELRIVRHMLHGEVMRILDGPFGIADVTIENIQNGRDNDYLEEFMTRIREITPAQIRALAERYLVPEEFTTVVVGEHE